MRCIDEMCRNLEALQYTNHVIGAVVAIDNTYLNTARCSGNGKCVSNIERPPVNADHGTFSDLCGKMFGGPIVMHLINTVAQRFIRLASGDHVRTQPPQRPTQGVALHNAARGDHDACRVEDEPREG
jgi:hypothetical protein